MSKRLIVLCAIALVLGLAVSANAAVQNVKVSGDLKASAIGRDQFDLGTAGVDGGSSVIMSQVRVKVDADLTDNVSTTVRLLSETDWGRENQNTNNTDVDIDLASVTLKEMLYSPLTVIIGRQELIWGAGFVLGDPDTNRTAMVDTAATAGTTPIANLDLSLRKSFDAVKVVLDYNPLLIEAFYSKIDENTQSGANTEMYEDKDDIDLYGVNAKYSLGDDWGTMLEGYLLYERDETTNAASAAGTLTGALDTSTIWAPGLRVVTAPIKDLMLTGEVAWQQGTFVNNSVATVTSPTTRHRNAMAAQATASYALPFEKIKKYSPEVGAAYSFYSGDKDAAETSNNVVGDYTAWDPLYENQGTGKIYNVLFDATDVHVLGLNAAFVPIEDLKIKAEYTDLWIAVPLPTKRPAGANLFTLYGIDGRSSTPNIGDEHLGREFDLSAAYDYTEDVQFGLSAGWFMSGNMFDTGPDDEKEVASQVIGTCSVSF